MLFDSHLDTCAMIRALMKRRTLTPNPNWLLILLFSSFLLLVMVLRTELPSAPLQYLLQFLQSNFFQPILLPPPHIFLILLSKLHLQFSSHKRRPNPDKHKTNQETEEFITDRKLISRRGGGELCSDSGQYRNEIFERVYSSSCFFS